MSTERSSLREWLARTCPNGIEIDPLTKEQLDAIFQWSTIHGSGNGWTGTSGTGAMHIRWLLRERERLLHELANVEAMAHPSR